MLPEHSKNMHDVITYVTFLGKVTVTIFREKNSTWRQRRKLRHELFWAGRVSCLSCTVSHFLVNFKGICNVYVSPSFLTLSRKFNILA